MLETSKDLLFVTLSVCVVGITVFVCWFLYYLISLLKNAYSVSKHVEGVVSKIDSIVDVIRGKINSSTAYMAVAFEAVKQVVGFVKERRRTVDDEDEKTKKKK